MKFKTAELEGARLDQAAALAMGWKRVADADGVGWLVNPGEGAVSVSEWQPSLNWRQGGPIIERAAISVYPAYIRDNSGRFDGWTAYARGARDIGSFGPTPLIAAMRAFVAFKLGAEVELP